MYTGFHRRKMCIRDRDITKGFLTNRDISFKIQREEAKIPNVLVDPVRLRDVLVNILSNAVKFTPDGGAITFETRCQEKGGDGYITMHYRISDTGIGCLLYTSRCV